MAQQPAAKLRDRKLSLTIWENMNDEGTIYYTSILTKSYKNEADQWLETGNLNPDDMLKAANLLQQGYNKILELKSNL